jgi:hypothetical protein
MIDEFYNEHGFRCRGSVTVSSRVYGDIWGWMTNHGVTYFGGAEGMLGRPLWFWQFSSAHSMDIDIIFNDLVSDEIIFEFKMTFL